MNAPGKIVVDLSPNRLSSLNSDIEYNGKQDSFVEALSFLLVVEYVITGLSLALAIQESFPQVSNLLFY